MDEMVRIASETMSIIAEMRADLPHSALGTPSWSRLNRLEDTVLRVVAQASQKQLLQ